MEEHITPQDYIRYDRVWQRVSPELNPYPAAREAAAAPVPAPPAAPSPFCLTDYIDRALDSRRLYARYAACAPTAAARRTLKALSEEELAHARRLAALHFVQTGSCYRPSRAETQLCPLPRQELLRKCWQEECCSAEAFARAAGDADNGCLRQTLSRLSQEEYRHAAVLLQLLETNALA